MSFAITAPEIMTAAATQFASVGAMISAANAAATAPTTGVVAAAADEVSAAVSGLFSAYAEESQVVSTQAAAFHEQFVGLLNGSAAAYLSTEIANAEQTLINGVSAPARTLLGHSLIPTGGSSAVGRGAGAVAGQAVGTATLLSGRVAASVQSVSASQQLAQAITPA